MTLKQNQPVLAKYLADGNTLPISEPGTGVTIDDQAHVVRRARLTLTGATLAILAANDYGSLKVCDMPDSNLMVLYVEANLSMVKGGVANGLLSTVDLDVGMGGSPASAATLATTMIDVLEKTDVDTDALTVTYQADTQAQTTATTPNKVVDSATSALYLNVGLPVGITADDALTITGTIDIVYIDLGNENS